MALVAYFLPLLLVLYKRLWREIPFLLFGLYWMLNGVVNLVDKITIFQPGTIEIIKVAYNTIDIPLVLLLVNYSTTSQSLKRYTRAAAPSFFGLEMVNFLLQGWNYNAAKYVMGLGLVLVLVAVVWVISLYMQKLEHSALEHALVFFHVSLFFAYGTFVIIYIFYYYVQITDSGIDNYLIYYFSSFVAVMIASYGYLVRKSSQAQLGKH